MKSKFFGIAVLILALATVSFAYTWGEMRATQALVPQDGQVILDPSGNLDDPQPDTLLYDDNIGNWLAHGVSNFWASVRFTAPVEFELLSIYVYPNNQNNNNVDNLTLTITDDNAGSPGNTLATVVVPAPIGTNWIDANLRDPLIFDEGEDFHIYYNIPGGTYPTDLGWWPRYDASTTTFRSKLSTNGVTWDPWNADCLLRAGGELGEGFVDLASQSVYNTTGEFFHEAGTEISFMALVENLGVDPCPTYTYEWSVEDEGGSEIWNYANAYSDLGAGASVTLTAGELFTIPEDGSYEVIGTVNCPGDADPSNDIGLLEQYANSLDAWYGYDDGTGESQFTMDPTDAFGNSFQPTLYPVKVDTVAVQVGDNANCKVSIYQNDNLGNPSTELWFTNVALTGGEWAYITVTEDVSIYDNTFTVAVEAIEATTMRMDDDPPLAAQNANMNTAGMQKNVAGWSAFEGSDVLARAYLTESTTTPPFPVLDIGVDTVFFDNTPFGQTATYVLTVANAGGLDDLVISTMQLSPTTPPDIFTMETLTYPLTIPAGGSVDVEFYFSPVETDDEEFTCNLGILSNNNGNPNTFNQFPVYGTGTTVNVLPRNGDTPDVYALGQNHPNPFNPTTTIGYSLPQAGHVELVVFNVLGEEISRLVDSYMNQGIHFVEFKAENLTSGIYFYRISSGDFTEMKKMILMK